MICVSQNEREAWLNALRSARHLSAHRLHISELGREKAEAAAREAKSERESMERHAEALQLEVNANEAAAQRARQQLDAFGAHQREGDSALAAKEDELQTLAEEGRRLGEAREKLMLQLKRSEEQAARLLGERDAAEAAREEMVQQLADARKTAADASGRAAHAVELAQRLAILEQELEEARDVARREAERANAAEHAAEEDELEKERRRLAAEQRALHERRAARLAEKQQQAAVSNGTHHQEPAQVVVEETAVISHQQQWLSRRVSDSERQDELVYAPAPTPTSAPAAGSWRSSISMPRLSLPQQQPRKSIRRESAARSSRTSQQSEVDVLRMQVEEEENALKQKRAEREARRLKRQLELAEANDELPAEPPPVPRHSIKTRGRQMSNVI
jgi:hypothetical protein